ncbi:hypothetical protein JI664_03320 [Rhodobacter sp. NTK016B]|uniref:ABC transporter substrate-binding protein n=1 Tax=Rhodobacter sp. NTK016B TaxID=2759676 RepID=UPI001A8EE417|nr:ABC transporter substrate-binding protein [Rhodobacter sp. NTK016B]MBN8290987.1 hypothetical protein [Rhodobacter sp. NTK016B]
MPTRRQTLTYLAAAFGAPAALMAPARVFAQDGRPVLRVAVQALNASLEPFESANNVGLRAVDALFDRPLRRNFVEEAANPGTTVIDPQLALSVEQIEPLIWEMRLRPDVILHDGRTFSADDVLATLSPARVGPDSPYADGRVLFSFLDRVEKIDDLTVHLHTVQEDVVLPHRMAGYGPWIVSGAALDEMGADAFRLSPVGSGPYKMNSFERDARLVLDSHDEYWMGQPAAAQVIFTVVPEVSTRIAGLISGEYDIVTNVLPDQVSQLASYDDIEVQSAAMDLLHILTFDTSRPVMQNKLLRQALATAIDYDAIGQAVWGENYQRPRNFQIPSFGPFYDPERAYFQYDPEAARALLVQSGYDGAEIVLRVPPTYYLGSGDMAQIVQAMWQEIGVNVRLEMSESALTAAEPGADVRMVSTSFRYPDPLSGGVGVHMGPNSFVQQRGFWQPEGDYNDVLAAFEAETEQSRRVELFHRLLDILEDEAPVTILYSVNENVGVSTEVNWTQYPLYYFDLRPDVFSFRSV